MPSPWSPLPNLKCISPLVALVPPMMVELDPLFLFPSATLLVASPELNPALCPGKLLGYFSLLFLPRFPPPSMGSSLNFIKDDELERNVQVPEEYTPWKGKDQILAGGEK